MRDRKQSFVWVLLGLLFWFLAGNVEVWAGKVKVGSSDVTSSAGIFIANEKGYFKEFGLDVDLVIVKGSGAPMTVLLAKGQLDIGGGNITSGLWNAIAEGQAIRIVADKGSIPEASSYIHLIVRTDHVQSARYKSFKDLKGFTMALTALEGVSQQIIAERFLKAGGLAASDVTFIKMPYPEMNLALKGKTIDATIQLEPYSTLAELDGVATIVAGANEVYPGQPSAAILYSPRFAEGQRDDGVKFMAAYLKGVRDYSRAYKDGTGWEEIIRILKKYTGIESDEVWKRMSPAGLNPDGYINVEALKNDLLWYSSKGYLNKMPQENSLVDHSFIDAAIKLVGRFKKND